MMLLPWTILGDAVIFKTGSYTYLGAFISNDEMSSDCPHNIKYKVWNSVLNAAVLYSCEIWITNELESVEKPYLISLKQMLGLRNTCGDPVHIETCPLNVKSLIIDLQVKFLVSLRAQHVDDHTAKIINTPIVFNHLWG